MYILFHYAIILLRILLIIMKYIIEGSFNEIKVATSQTFLNLNEGQKCKSS